MTQQKKQIKNKKVKAVLATGVVLATLGLGSTYSWFTSNSEATKTAQLTTGTLGATADLNENLTFDYLNVEPGEQVPYDISFENTGSLALFLKTSIVSPTAPKLSSTQLKSNIAPPENYSFDATNKSFVWYVEKSNSENYYLLMQKGAKVPAQLFVTIDGESTDNLDQGISINQKIGQNSVQARANAIKGVFNIDLKEDVELFSGNAPRSPETIEQMKSIANSILKDK